MASNAVAQMNTALAVAKMALQQGKKLECRVAANGPTIGEVIDRALRLGLQAQKREVDFGRLVNSHQDALTLLSGWVESKSPKKYLAEHRADLEKKIELLKEVTRGA